MEIRKYLATEGFLDGTPVQRACWKEMAEGRNCRVVSQPGTGKTLAFLLPIAVRLKRTARPADPCARALIFVPTRELANQIFHVCERLRKLFKLTTASACGGAPIAEQIQQIQSGVDILAGTPGRLVELVYDQHIHLKGLQIVVLDEADKMLSGDLGRQLNGLKEYVFSSDDQTSFPQVCAFSATLPEEMDPLLQDWIGQTAVSLSFSTDAHLVSASISQVVHVCAEHKKLMKLKKHLRNIREEHAQERLQPRILIFANTVKKVRSIHGELQQFCSRIAMLHGKRSPAERHEAVEGFRSGKVQTLVATDVAGRGLDIKNLPYVVNFDFPTNLETYIHRVGRTGRLAAYGHAFSFFTRNLAPMAKDLVALLQLHQQPVDPNLLKLQESYTEAMDFMKKLEEIEQDSSASREGHVEEQAATDLMESLADALSPRKKRRKSGEESAAAAPVFARRR